MRTPIGARVLTHLGTGFVVYVGWDYIEISLDGYEDNPKLFDDVAGSYRVISYE
jgi:hypothetical protein